MVLLGPSFTVRSISQWKYRGTRIDSILGDGSYASGGVWTDVVQLGGLELSNVTVETATSVSESMVSDDSMSGLLGLAYNHSSTVVPPAPTFLDVLTPILDEKLFTVDLKYHDMGYYDFGMVNSSRYTGNVSYQPLLNPAEFWEFYMQGIHVGGNNTWLLHDWPVVADTGTSLMLLPEGIVDMYWAAVSGAYNNPLYGGYVFPCNQTAMLPSFSMGFNEGLVVEVPGEYMNFESITPGLCYGGIQYGFNLAFSILGDVFLKACFTVFDLDNARFGIANKPLSA